MSADAYDRVRVVGSALEQFGLPSVERLDSQSFTERRIGLEQIDHAVIGYHRKKSGRDPWPVFELPPSLRDAERQAA